ncbi:hypothetical protein [Brevibacillus reuszeri]|uniref:hypothetical protein n=1 Tax=Brevibacillus reuszeri TaxID=54915 RepID=UPI0013DF8F8C|nr:hypothetical protein [Brevibacillus reuszeri]
MGDANEVKVFGEFGVGGYAEIISTSHDDKKRILYGAVGKIVEIKASKQYGNAELRLHFGDGYETWMPAEDCTSC